MVRGGVVQRSKNANSLARIESEASGVPFPPLASPSLSPSGGARNFTSAESLRMKGPAAHRADARAEICRLFDDFRRAENLTARQALPRFIAEYRAHGIEVREQTRDLISELSETTLKRWLRGFARDGWAGLLDRRGAHRDELIERTPGLADFVLAMLAHQPHVRVTRIQEAIQARFPAPRPSVRTVQRFVARWKAEHPALFMRMRDPDDFKRKFSLALGRADAEIARAGQLFEIDGTRLEVECTDGRFHLNAIIDVFTRRIVAQLSPSASAQATADLLRKAIPIIGVPETIKSDWGKEYMNARIQRAARRLKINWAKVARPYAGELKPFIERGIGTALHMFFEQCPGYRGHNVRQAAEIRARHSFQARRGERRNLARLYNVELSSSDLQALLDRWLQFVYGERPHDGLDGRTPNQVFAAAESRGEVRRVSEERALDLLLAEDGLAKVGTK